MCVPTKKKPCSLCACLATIRPHRPEQHQPIPRTGHLKKGNITYVRALRSAKDDLHAQLRFFTRTCSVTATELDIGGKR